MIFCNLGSGSKGNSTYIQAEKGAVLVDQGFSLKNLTSRMINSDLSPKDISAIILTHEHSDHLHGIGILARRYKTPIYMTEKTRLSIEESILKNTEVVLFNSGDTIELEDMSFKTFHIPHDAADPIGIVAGFRDKKIGILTDLGTVTQSVLHHVSGLDLLFLESNHDMFMLLNGPYPLRLIQRIKSRVGHLSNDQALSLFEQIPKNGKLKHLVLGHLSENNNDPQVVRESFEEQRDNYSTSYQIEIASQYKPGNIVTI